MWLWLWACSGSPTGDDLADDDTGRSAPVVAACVPTDNALRFDCTLEAPRAVDVVWEVLDDGVVVRTFATPSATTHAVGLWGLAPETPFTWRATTAAGTAEGTVQTGPLPAGLADVDIVLSGTPVDVDHVTLGIGCGDFFGKALVGSDGVIRWYEGLSAFEGAKGMLTNWIDGDQLLIARAGRLVLRHASGVDALDAPLPDAIYHHDATRVGDHLVVLMAEQVGDYVIDGVHVFDLEGTLVDTWRLDAWVVPSGPIGSGGWWADEFPGADDYSHANSVTPDGPGHVLVGLRNQNVVLRLAVDPTQPGFGEVDWSVTGRVHEIPGDFSWTDGDDFVMQHHASRFSTGEIGVYDNRSPPDASRVVLMTLDPVAGEVHASQTWSLGRNCLVQGTAAELPGGALSTCIHTGEVHEFRRGVPDPVWTLTATCAGEPVQATRAQAVTLTR